MSRVHWIELRPRDPASAGLATLRFAGGARHRSYFREENGQHYKAGLVAAPRFAARIGFGKDGFTGQTIPQASRIQIAPAEADVFESLAGYFWKDAAITIDAGPEDASTFPRLFTGTVVGDAIADGVFTFTIADLSTRLDKPVCTARFAGNGGIEGGEEAEGRTKRRSWGFVFNVEGRLLDPANSIYEFGDPTFPLSSFSALRDKGRGGPFTVLAWQGSIAATFAALQASSPAQGGGVVAPSIACAKWWTEPSGPLTADFVGTPGTGGSMAAASLIDSISAHFAGPAVTGRTATNALRPAAAGIHVGDESTTGAQLIDRLALGSSLVWVAAPEGVIRLLPWTFDNGDAEPLQGQFISRERAYAPHYRRRVGFQANNRRHSESEIAESIRLDDGVLFESLRPAEPNATAGAVIPDPLTYVPGDPYPGYIRDEAGNVRAPGELLNSSIELTPGGLMQYRDTPTAVPVKLGKLELPALGAAAANAVSDASDEIDALTGALALALDRVSRLSQTVTRAGIRVDPATGSVVIDAVEATRERVNTAEIRLNAQDASIRLKASTSYVDERIALAVIDPSQTADLEDVYFRLGQAEVAIEGLSGSINLLASSAELSALEARVSTAEVDIESLEGLISLKVDTIVFDGLADRVTNAELSIASLGDISEIVLQVGATRLIADDLAANEEADLLALLQADHQRRQLVSGISLARQELTALVNENGSAEARFRQSLQAQFGAQTAVFASQIQVLSTANLAFAEQLGELSAQILDQFETLQGAIEDAAQISLERDNLLTATVAQQVSLGRVLEGDAIDQADSLLDVLVRGELSRLRIAGEIAASRQELTAQIVPELSALLQRVSAIIARVSDAEASILRQETVFATADTALAEQIETANASLGQRIDDEVEGLQQQVQDEADARIQAIIAEAEARGEALSAEEQARIAAIEEERDARIAEIAAERIAREGEIERIEQVIVEGDERIAAGLRDQVAVARGLDIDVADAADELLRSIIEADRARRITAGHISAARSELNAEIVEGRVASAQKTDLLIARVAGAEANIIEQSRVVGSLEGSTAQRFLEVRSEFTQAVEDEAVARTQAINDTADGLILQIENEAQARGEALTAEELARIEQINGERDDRIAAIEAARLALMEEIAASEAAVRDEIIAQTGPGSALAGRVSSVETRVGENEAAIEAFAESIDGVAARGGLRFDVNGRVTGVGVTATAVTTLFSALVDAFELVDPVTGFKYLAATPEGVRLRNIEVDTLKAGIVSASKMTGAAMGETAFAYAEPSVNTDGFNWVNIISVGLTPIHGRPAKLMFSALIRDTTDANTVIKVRIVRDDGAIIYGESARRTGAHLNITDEGVPVCIPIVDTVAAGRATTWTFQMAKVTEQNVICEASFRFAQAEELSRVNTQASSIVLGGGSGGEPGPGVPPTNPPGGSNPVP